MEAPSFGSDQRHREHANDVIACNRGGRGLGAEIGRDVTGFVDDALEVCRRDAGLERQFRHPAIAGVEVQGCRRVRCRRAIMLPQGLSKAIVTRRSAESLDMGVFVESSDSLRGELTAEPVGFLDQTYAAS